MDLGSAASRAWWLAKGPGRAARRRSQNVDYLAEWAEFEVKLVTRAPVIIYSMGKSGTTSLTVALREAGFPVVKVHSLTKAATAKRALNRFITVPPRERQGYESRAHSFLQ